MRVGLTNEVGGRAVYQKFPLKFSVASALSTPPQGDVVFTNKEAYSASELRALGLPGGKGQS